MNSVRLDTGPKPVLSARDWLYVYWQFSKNPFRSYKSVPYGHVRRRKQCAHRHFFFFFFPRSHYTVRHQYPRDVDLQSRTGFVVKGRSREAFKRVPSPTKAVRFVHRSVSDDAGVVFIISYVSFTGGTRILLHRYYDVLAGRLSPEKSSILHNNTRHQT